MNEAKFTAAFDTIADVVQRASELPNHRERPTESHEVTVTAAQGNVRVSIKDAVVSSLWIDQLWVESVLADELATTISQATNEALELWNAQQLEELMTITPDMKELNQAITTARSQLDDAWVATLAEAKAPGQ